MEVEQHKLETIAVGAQFSRRMHLIAAVVVLVAAVVNLFAGVLAATVVAVFARFFTVKTRITYGAIAVILLFIATLFMQL